MAAAKEFWIPGWKDTRSMTTARAGAAVVAYNKTIYIIGGVDGVNFLNSVEGANVKSDGSLSRWTKLTPLPEQRGFMSAVVFNQRIYVAGGGNGLYGKHLLNSIVSAPILTSGELGSWRTETSTMLTPRRCAKLTVVDDKLHVFGGFNGALLDTVETSQFLPDGTLATWKMQKNQMIMPRYVNEVKKLMGYAFAIGGHHPKKGLGIADVEFTNLKQLPLVWQVAPAMKTGRYAFASATFKHSLYAFGGISGAEYLNSTEKMQLNKNNAPSHWQFSTKLPSAMANFSAIVVDKWVYLLGGSTRHKYLPNVSVASFNAMGDIGYYGTQVESVAFKGREEKAQQQISLPNNGRVLEYITTESYTYIRVKMKQKKMWLAAPKIAVSVNQNIHFSEGVYMSNFMSKTLNRQFDSILFVGTVKPD